MDEGEEGTEYEAPPDEECMEALEGVPLRLIGSIGNDVEPRELDEACPVSGA